jgi:hypothetical protein
MVSLLWRIDDFVGSSLMLQIMKGGEAKTVFLEVLIKTKSVRYLP